MKKVILSLTVVALLGLSAQAQDDAKKKTPVKSSFGVAAGVDARNVYGDDEAGNKLEENKTAIKWHLGVNYEMPIATSWVFQPGLSVAAKGTQFKYTGGDKTEVNLYYLDIPLNIIYKIMQSSGNSVLIGFGPYFGFGVGGKVKDTDGTDKTELDVEYRNTVSLADQMTEKAFFKRMDAGANVQVGYEWANGFNVNLNTSVGLAKINPAYEGMTADKSKIRHIGFGLGFGYRFGR